MYQAQNKKYEETRGRLENELKNRPEVLNMPPLKTVFGKEVELQQELKHKETFIVGLKFEFENTLREMINKQQNETAEYETRLQKMNKTIKNKNELLQKKKIERISTTLVAKSAGRGKKSTVKGEQVYTSEESIVKG